MNLRTVVANCVLRELQLPADDVTAPLASFVFVFAEAR